MRILVVTATDAEVAPLAEQLRGGSDTRPRVTTFAHARHEVEILTTGVGMVATAAWCSRALADHFDLALNFGVCGSFSPAFELGSVVQVMTERLTELGAEDGDTFLPVRELGLLGDDDFPFRSGQLENSAPPVSSALQSLPEAHGITVNTVHGNARSIGVVRERFRPDVESMEGAAFMYACLIHGVPFAQVRAVSNLVERRNRAGWKLEEAIRRLADAGIAILNSV